MRNAENLPPYCAVVKKSRSLKFLDPSGTAWPVTGVLYFFTLLCYIIMEVRDILHAMKERRRKGELIGLVTYEVGTAF